MPPDNWTPLFEQGAVQCKMLSFHSKLLSLKFHHCSTCFECFPDLIMAAAGSTECRRCSQDKHIPKLYSTANNMIPGVVPPQLQVSLCVHSKHSPPLPSHLLSFTLYEIVFITHILYLLGSLTSGGIARLCYFANNVNLPTALGSVWLHWSCDQSSSGCDLICSLSSKTTFRPRCFGCEEREGTN